MISMVKNIREGQGIKPLFVRNGDVSPYVAIESLDLDHLVK
jgi:hypothetical protein